VAASTRIAAVRASRRRSAPIDRSFLVVVDRSRASRRAAIHLARLVGGRPGYRLSLLYLIPPIPTELRETRGDELPADEERLDARLKSAQRQWVADARRAAARTLADMESVVRESLEPETVVERICSEPVDERGAAAVVLASARAHHCGTIIVARKAMPWCRRLFERDLADDLVRSAHGPTLLVVE
jgi:hypothetical protein